MAKLIDDETGSKHLDRYELVAELAAGGMATVFLARLRGLGGFQRFVAIKRLHPHLQHEQEFVQMFLDEARLAAGIHHPNVVPILEVGATPAGYYLVMEYIEGDTLARLLARAASVPDAPLPARVAVRVVLDTLAGLHAAHELRDDFGRNLQIVHRDVSPQNVIVGVDGIARITDFGVARAASRLTSTRAGQMKGKLAYMPPEQARGEEIDRRADVFSAGIVLWETLCMRRLFKGETDAETLNRVVVAPIPRLRDHAPQLPQELDDILARALEREREARFASCVDFADAIERAAGAHGLLATAREVAAYVQSTMGQEIAAQRDKVRAWLARSEPSQAWPGLALDQPAGAPATSVSAAAMAIPTVPPPHRQALQATALGRTARGAASRWAVWAVVAAVLAILGAGSAGVVAWLRRSPDPAVVPAASSPPAEPADATAAAASSSAAPEPAPRPADAAAPSAASPAPAPPKGRGGGSTPPRSTPGKGAEPDDMTSNPYR
jgi:serine/threonine-protein kinase